MKVLAHQDRYREFEQAKDRAKYRAVQAATERNVSRYRQPWTQEEIELALDYKRTTAEVAFKLGRTFAAVKRIRKRYGPSCQ
jgi:hypothetical protein